MSLINLTPHAVNIYNEVGEMVRSIPSSGAVRLSQNTVRCGETDGVPLSKTVYGDVQGLPEYQEGTMYIVSALVFTALPDRSDLCVPAEAVRDGENRIIGCKSFGVR